jgi:hypothetical protein
MQHTETQEGFVIELAGYFWGVVWREQSDIYGWCDTVAEACIFDFNPIDRPGYSHKWSRAAATEYPTARACKATVTNVWEVEL